MCACCGDDAGAQRCLLGGGAEADSIPLRLRVRQIRGSREVGGTMHLQEGPRKPRR